MYEYLDRRYAKALYELAEKNNKVEEYIQDLKEIVSIINSNEELKKIIIHPEISIARKKEVFSNLFKEHIDPELLSFLMLLISKDRIVELEKKVIELEKIHLERQNKVLAEVKTVIPLTEEERTALIKKLEKKCDKTVILKEVIDPSIIGGVYVRIGNDVIDGTIKSKLDEMRELILKEE